jgi:hypothetical protein
MAKQLINIRKRRTRQHVIADLSMHHLEGFILEQGHTAQRLSSDYSYDLLLRTFDEGGYPEPGLVYIQVKAAESLQSVASDQYVFDADIRDYHLWVHEEMPVLLVLYDATRRKSYWLAVQRYFQDDTARQPKKGAKTVRVRVPKRQAVHRRAIERMRELKQQMTKSRLGVRS